MHDPMAMRPFMGYNFGDYLSHWLDLNKPGRHMPKIFHVNWFRTDSNGKLIFFDEFALASLDKNILKCFKNLHL